MVITARILLVALLVFWQVPSALAQVAINDVRLGVHPDKTRIVLDVSGSPRYRAFTLTNPHRVVIDVTDGTWNVPEASLTQGRGLVSAVRHARFNASTYRLVIEVTRPVTITKDFVLPANPSQKLPVRLVLDVEASGASTVPTPSTGVPSAAAPIPRPSPTVSAQQKPLIVIDPGHGGKDPGAIGPTGLREKDIVLTAARELRQALLATGEFRVYLTRDNDVFLRLNDRVRLANQAGGDLFISLHADAHSNRNAIGASVYTLSQQASDRDAAALAARENRADVFDGAIDGESDEVSRILIDLVKRETMNFSAQYATYLVNNLKDKITLKQDNHRFAGFAVLRSPDIPSVLVEMGYLSNPREEWLLKQASHRKKIVDGIVRGTQQYFVWKKSLSQ
jgi:N-acetylmuramoyl-L-alanine amidase